MERKRQDVKEAWSVSDMIKKRKIRLVLKICNFGYSNLFSASDLVFRISTDLVKKSVKIRVNPWLIKFVKRTQFECIGENSWLFYDQNLPFVGGSQRLLVVRRWLIVARRWLKLARKWLIVARRWLKLARKWLTVVRPGAPWTRKIIKISHPIRVSNSKTRKTDEKDYSVGFLLR